MFSCAVGKAQYFRTRRLVSSRCSCRSSSTKEWRPFRLACKYRKETATS
ncbi:hypothetical protein ANCDUO_14344 [Ancylostoma duodenale]|uniref:Uncharacterized protein n=1 Tax=Ancylostoma duodenale TaxID=51022 RepID=A0A0C2G9G2_9BILA|nr:hypothetical protein ANCDUO_14344 [Ancylostoma duodenale]